MPQQENKVSDSKSVAQPSRMAADFDSARLPSTLRHPPLRFDLAWPRDFSAPQAITVRQPLEDFLRLAQAQDLFRSDGPASYKIAFGQLGSGSNYSNNFQGWSSFLFDNFKVNINSETLRQLAPLGVLLLCAVQGGVSINTKLARNTELQLGFQSNRRLSLEIRIR